MYWWLRILHKKRPERYNILNFESELQRSLDYNVIHLPRILRRFMNWSRMSWSCIQWKYLGWKPSWKRSATILAERWYLYSSKQEKWLSGHTPNYSASADWHVLFNKRSYDRLLAASAYDLRVLKATVISVFRLRKERKEREVRGNSGVSLTLRFLMLRDVLVWWWSKSNRTTYGDLLEPSISSSGGRERISDRNSTTIVEFFTKRRTSFYQSIDYFKKYIL
jgi:hypothetical protein